VNDKSGDTLGGRIGGWTSGTRKREEPFDTPKPSGNGQPVSENKQNSQTQVDAQASPYVKDFLAELKLDQVEVGRGHIKREPVPERPLPSPSQTTIAVDPTSETTSSSKPTKPSMHNPFANWKYTKSTSDILRQLPENDEDLLTADQIRASMRAKRHHRDPDEERNVSRAELEQNFRDAQNRDLDLDPAAAAKIINDQMERRAASTSESDKGTKQAAVTGENASGPALPTCTKETELPGKESPEGQSISNSPMETSLDRIVRLESEKETIAEPASSESSEPQTSGLPSRS
jgi:hypothetical protein